MTSQAAHGDVERARIACEAVGEDARRTAGRDGGATKTVNSAQ
jgi:hypothetical protein